MPNHAATCRSIVLTNTHSMLSYFNAIIVHWPCKVAGKCISAVNSEAFRSYRKHSGGLYILEDKKKMHTFILSICQFWLLNAITSSSGAPDKVVRSNSAHRTSTAQRSPSLFTLTHKRFEIKRHLTCTISKQVSFLAKFMSPNTLKKYNEVDGEMQPVTH